jgi:NADPH:quinone reductase-like Zn-dependent oxidoreductase
MGTDLFLPIGIGSSAGPPLARHGGTADAEVRVDGDARTDRELTADVTLRDERGEAVVALTGVRLGRATRDTLLRTSGADLGSWLFRVDWTPVAPAGTSAAEGVWLLLGDRGRVHEEVARRLRETGADARLLCDRDSAPLDLGDADAVERRIAEIAGDRPVSIVDLRALDHPAGPPSDLATIEAEQAELGAGLLHVLRAAARLGEGSVVAVRVVTRGSQDPAGTGCGSALAAASLWGLARSAMREIPSVDVRMLDLDDASECSAELLVAELTAGDGEPEVALRPTGRYAPRLVRANAEGRNDDLPPGPRALEVAARGSLDGLALNEVARRAPGRGEVEIRVHAAGLNFRDVLNALGTYPGDAGPLGSECAGEVVAVGPGVTRFSVGDRVFGMAGRAFADHATTSEALIAPIPDGLTWAEAAAAPVAFLTAWYALREVGRLGEGETVLVHAAAGGVGLAALQVARDLGAYVIGTAGSARKRALLHRAGVEHVFDSRSTSFADDVLDVTAGRGVDVVLNSLTGDAIEAGFRATAAQGRFVEIGKLDVWSDDQASAQRDDVEYTVVDLIRVCLEDPDLVREMLAASAERLGDGRFRPLPVRAFPLESALDAFRTMAQARHIGKLVLMPASGGMEAGGADGSAGRFRADATYLVTGGLGGLGLAVSGGWRSRALVESRSIGRSAPNADAHRGDGGDPGSRRGRGGAPRRCRGS